jgi:hypothetical protein
VGGQVDRANPLGQRRAGVEQTEELGQGRARLLHEVEQLAQLLDGFEQVGEVEHEGGQRPHRDRIAVHEDPAQADDGRGRGHAGQLDDGEVAGREFDGAHLGVELRLVLLGEAPLLHVLAPEGLDHAYAGQPLLQGGQRLADAVAHREVGLVRRSLEAHARDDHDGQADHAKHGEHRRHGDEHDHGQHDEEGVGDELHEALLHELLEGVDV